MALGEFLYRAFHSETIVKFNGQDTPLRAVVRSTTQPTDVLTWIDLTEKIHVEYRTTELGLRKSKRTASALPADLTDKTSVSSPSLCVRSSILTLGCMQLEIQCKTHTDNAGRVEGYIKWLKSLSEGERATLIVPAGCNLMHGAAMQFSQAYHKEYCCLRHTRIFTREGVLRYMKYLCDEGYQTGLGAKRHYSESAMHSTANALVLGWRLESLLMVLGCSEFDLANALVSRIPKPNADKAVSAKISKLEVESGSRKQQEKGTSRGG